MDRSLTDRLKIGLLAAVVVVGAAVFVYRWWTRPPAVEFDNLRYVQLLRTAVSAQNPEWLAGVERAIAHRVAEGQMSPAEREHFASILTMAHSGRWDDADRAAWEFEVAQLGRRRQRPPAEHGDGHAH